MAIGEDITEQQDYNDALRCSEIRHSNASIEKIRELIAKYPEITDDLREYEELRNIQEFNICTDMAVFVQVRHRS